MAEVTENISDKLNLRMGETMFVSITLFYIVLQLNCHLLQLQIDASAMISTITRFRVRMTTANLWNWLVLARVWGCGPLVRITVAPLTSRSPWILKIVISAMKCQVCRAPPIVNWTVTRTNDKVLQHMSAGSIISHAVLFPAFKHPTMQNRGWTLSCCSLRAKKKTVNEVVYHPLWVIPYYDPYYCIEP